MYVAYISTLFSNPLSKKGKKRGREDITLSSFVSFDIL